MSYASTILATTDLLAFWPFDEPSGSTAADAFGSADLTVAGGVTLGADPLVDRRCVGGGVRPRDRGPGVPRDVPRRGGISFEGWFRCDDLSGPGRRSSSTGAGPTGSA